MAELLSTTCPAARVTLERLRVLKRDFDAAYDEAADSVTPAVSQAAQAIKRRLTAETAALQESLSATEIERTFDLRHQYGAQLVLLENAGLTSL
jgi:hypothetical protein